MNEAFFITPTAAEETQKRLQKRNTPDALLRIGVRGGGCAGYTYVLEYDDSSPRNSDFVVESNNVKIVIDRKSLAYLKGSTLDYVKTLTYEGFKFLNPQQTGTCGCGSSVSLQTQKVKQT